MKLRITKTMTLFVLLLLGAVSFAAPGPVYKVTFDSQVAEDMIVKIIPGPNTQVNCVSGNCALLKSALEFTISLQAEGNHSAFAQVAVSVQPPANFTTIYSIDTTGVSWDAATVIAPYTDTGVPGITGHVIPQFMGATGTH